MADIGVVALLTAATALVANARAQGLPPWTEPGRLPLPEDARSVEIRRKDEPLFVAPSATAARRGAAALGARLPLYAVESGPGCRGEWLLVGPLAWVCSDVVRVSDETPLPAAAPIEGPRDGMPFEYFFVGSEGTLGYRDLSTAEETRPAAELQPGFAVAITDTRPGVHGEPLALSTKGLWMPSRDLRRIHPSTFHGYEVIDGKLDRGFVIADSTPVFDAPNGKRGAVPPRVRFDTVPVLELTTVKDRRWVRIDEKQWLDGRDVRVPELSPVPERAAPGERWIDVDIASQVVTAYEGDRPVFATLASTGIGRGVEITATPVGTHRVWVKLRTTDMTNLEDQEALRYYAMQEVPWVLFFEKGYGFHGAFWHQSFGHVRSHGCVNLTPLDAERVFHWASPRLPAGWTAALPTEYDPGTLVRVR